jgi:hypothetical protein
MDITLWLNNFKKYWTDHNVPEVLNLFQKDVVYFETPFHQLETRGQLEKAWKEINNQENIELDCEVFNKEENTYSIIWKLIYTQNSIKKNFAGTYLIKLDSNNLCTYFFHCCESK